MCFHSLLGELTPRTSANPGIDFLPLWDCLALWSEFDLDRCGHSLAMELLRRLAFRCYSCKLRPLLPHLSLPDSRRTSTKFTSFDNGDDFLPEFLAQEPPMHRLLICSRELEARTLHGSWNLTCDYAADFDWLRRESGRLNQIVDLVLDLYHSLAAAVVVLRVGISCLLVYPGARNAHTAERPRLPSVAGARRRLGLSAARVGLHRVHYAQGPHPDRELVDLLVRDFGVRCDATATTTGLEDVTLPDNGELERVGGSGVARAETAVADRVEIDNLKDAL